MLIQSRKQASLITKHSAAGEAVETAVKTPIKIGGTVTGKDLAATVVIKDSVTGDTANLGFFASLLLLVGGMMVTLTAERRRKEI